MQVQLFSIKNYEIKKQSGEIYFTFCIKQHNIEFYSSESNILRSLNVYYSSNVMGKRKYISVRKSNRGPAVVNFVSYKKLSKFIQEIEIGVLHDIYPISTEGMPDEEIGPGFFCDTCSYVKRLAKFYLIVNEKRVDKICAFENYERKNQSSIMFVLAIGGDEAPLSGTTFLLSFFNVSIRLTSSAENFLLFGANVNETGMIVRRYVLRLTKELKYLESNVFTVEANGKSYFVEFRVGHSPMI